MSDRDRVENCPPGGRYVSVLGALALLTLAGLWAVPGRAVAQAVCGNNVVESDEQCDDGNTFGGDGCASNCTTETERTFTFTAAGSQLEVQLTTSAFPGSLFNVPNGTFELVTGSARASEGTGLIPVVMRSSSFTFQSAVPGLAALCVQPVNYAPFGPGNFAAGFIACGSQPLADPSYSATQDFDTADEDPGCALGTLIGGFCVGPPQTTSFGLGGLGSAAIVAHFSISESDVLTSGPDTQFCTADDTALRQAVVAGLTTGSAAATISDSHFTYGSSTVSTTREGLPFDCDAIAGDPNGGLQDGALALSVPGVADLLGYLSGISASWRLSSIAPPTPTPTQTRTFTPTRTITSTRTASRTATPTRTFTPSPRPQAPGSLILDRVRAKADTSSKPDRHNGNLKIDATVNANSPFANFVEDVESSGLTILVSGAGGVDLAFTWQATDCVAHSTRRGPRISCKADDASGARKVVLRPDRTPNLFDLRLRARHLDIPSPLTASPVSVLVSTHSFDRADDIDGCEVSGGSGRRVSCRERGVVPTTVPTATPSPLGERVFTLARPGSAVFTSVLPTLDVTIDPWLSGPLRLVAGTPDANGVAPLSLAEDVIIGAKFVDGSTFCAKLFAAGSTGTIDCDGGSPQDVVQEENVPGTIISTGEGADAGPGAATLQLRHATYQLGSGTTVASCASLYYGSGYQVAYTTATTTGIYFNPTQGGDPVSLSKTGENFDCSTWTSEDSPGTLVAPISAYNSLVGTVMTVVELAGRVPGTPTPTIPPTETPTPVASGTPLGNRVFSIDGSTSEFRSTSGAGNLSTSNWLSGPLVLQAGAVDADGIAPLSLQSDVTYGFELAAGGVICVRLEAAGSAGTIDCDGGTPHSLLYTQDSNGSAPADPPILTVNLGPDSGPGAASLTVMQSVAELPSGAVPADCLTASFGPAAPTAYSTNGSTATVAEAVQGGLITLAVNGTNFSCATWTQEDGPGVLVGPRTVVDGTGDDEAQGFVLAD